MDNIFLHIQVFKSLEAGRWLPEEPYERQENFPAAKVCVLQLYNFA